jgi:predicted dehydrogenase
MGGGHCGSLMKIAEAGEENVKIVACCDVAKPRLDRSVADCAKRQGIKVSAHRYYQELIERKDVDAVLIASPEHWHAQMAIDAIQAGKDVYVEKPMTLDLPDAVRLMTAANKSDRIVEVGTQYVTDPKYHKARELIHGGRIGKPVSSVTGYCRNSKTGEWNYYKVEKDIVPGPNLDWEAWCGPLGPQKWDPLIYHRWRRYKKYSTGIVGDLLVHQMTPLIWAIDPGWPKRVVATGVHNIDAEMENFDQVNLTVEFDSGHTMVIWGSTCNATSPAPMVRGHKANLHLSSNNCDLVPEQIWVDDIDNERNRFDKGASHDALRVDWLQRTRDRKQVLSPVELGYKIMVIVDLAARSMWEGKAYAYDHEHQQGAAI